MESQSQLNIAEPIDNVETYKFDPIQGYPMLNWKGKRPFRSTQYYPAQQKETYGDEINGWQNKIYWGDNLQVMSHLLKTYRGQITLIYIDPPFDSKADYKMQIELRGKSIENDRSTFEEKQYTDIWTNDEYLQFMYERLILLRELLADNGSIYVHCDWRVNAFIRLAMDEIFGSDNFVNQIEWVYKTGGVPESVGFSKKHDHVLFYRKGEKPIFNPIYQKSYVPTLPEPHTDSGRRLGVMRDEICELCTHGSPGQKYRIVVARDVWDDIPSIFRNDLQATRYDTQKPEALLERIIQASSNPGDVVFDCFMGSGTTQAVAMKLGRRFIGADINLGAVEVTSKRLCNLASKIQENPAQGEIDIQEEGTVKPQLFYTGFDLYNVNHYDLFRNPVEAKNLIVEALEIQPLTTGAIYDGEKDGRMVKIMPINRIATRADLNELITGFDYRAFKERHEAQPTRPVEMLLLVCMGHEPDLAAALEQQLDPYKLDIKVVDILRDKSKLEFKRDSEARIFCRDGHLIIEQFYPMNLLQKLSLAADNVEDWRVLVESVKVDFNYDGAVLNPSMCDIPEGDQLVKGTYPVPENASTIRVKITDLLSESLEATVE